VTARKPNGQEQAQVDAVKEAVSEAAGIAADAAATVVQEAIAPVVSNASDQIGYLVTTLTKLETSLDRLSDSNKATISSRLPMALLLLAVLIMQIGLFVTGLQTREAVKANQYMIRCVLSSPEGQPAQSFNACVKDSE
jgi:hypothetical protein